MDSFYVLFVIDFFSKLLVKYKNHATSLTLYERNVNCDWLIQFESLGHDWLIKLRVHK